ncbi:hypothetical protein O181_133138 [Austropuccinia psidii MF-1]|uniref:Uncharacterized protein n=1 Tax=Austropuccinia psidii MF-1 TaxID=1389203 RepID=A0A9Q3L566_9BASI|nr:hypothetical protein [Austropuccinia psidii MF-1]
MDFNPQYFHEMMTRRKGSPYTSSSPLTPLDEEEPFTLGDLFHHEYFNMGEIVTWWNVIYNLPVLISLSTGLIAFHLSQAGVVQMHTSPGRLEGIMH